MNDSELSLNSKEMRRILPWDLQCLYVRPGDRVLLASEPSIYHMSIASWGKDCERVYFYRGHILPLTPADLSEAARILYREIQRIDNDLTPQP